MSFIFVCWHKCKQVELGDQLIMIMMGENIVMTRSLGSLRAPTSIRGITCGTVSVDIRWDSGEMRNGNLSGSELVQSLWQERIAGLKKSSDYECRCAGPSLSIVGAWHWIMPLFWAGLCHHPGMGRITGLSELGLCHYRPPRCRAGRLMSKWV